MTDILTTVRVVDDDRAVRDSLKLLLHSVGLNAETYASAAEFLENDDPAIPGCVVLDVRMPGMSGLELQEFLVSRGSRLPIVFVTAHGDIPMAVQAVKAGAIDFIQKPFRDQELLDKIQQAIKEDARRRRESSEVAGILQRMDSLTPRERQVMDLVVGGHANKVIAIDLGISERTVEIHRARVMQKMEADSVPHLVQMAIMVQDQLQQ